MNNTCTSMVDEDEFGLKSEMPSDTVFFWADKLLEVRDRIDEIELELKRLKNIHDNTETQLFNLMVSQNVDGFKRGGYSFAPTIRTSASIRAEHKPAALEWLKNSDYADIVKEQVNAQTLTSMVKEWIDNGIRPEDAPFMDYINVYDAQKISVKRGR